HYQPSTRSYTPTPFSFHGSAAHRALHSFPTRRSSDLHQRLVIGAQARTQLLQQRHRAIELGADAVADLRRLLTAGGLWREVGVRSEEHTSELQSRENLVCRLLLEKKKAHPRDQAFRQR